MYKRRVVREPRIYIWGLIIEPRIKLDFWSDSNLRIRLFPESDFLNTAVHEFNVKMSWTEKHRAHSDLKKKLSAMTQKWSYSEVK